MAGLAPGVVVAGVGLGWLAGAALQLHEAALWPLPVYVAALFCAVLLATTGRRRGWPWIVAAALAGQGLTGLHASLRVAERLDPALERVAVVAVGIVTSLPQRSATGVRFRFEPEAASHDGRPVVLPRRLELAWYTAAHEDGIGVQPPHALRAGERWRFTLRLRRPHGSFNPHGHDRELALFEQGVRATGHVRPGPAALLDAAAGAPVQRWRQAAREAIERQVPDRRIAGVLAALAVGDQGAIERDDWDLFRDTGVAHLMSISGLHVTMFAWLAGALLGALWRRSARLALWWPAPTAARWGGLACAAAYAVVAGFGVPAQRTLLMLASVVVLPSLGLRWPWPLVLLGAAVVVTLVDPWALLQPGFWLSFGAVALLLASEPARRSTPQAAPARATRLLAALRGGLRTQAVATLGLAPMTLVFFQQLSLVGFAANLVAIPLVTLLVTPLALLGLLAAPLWVVAAGLLEALSAWLGWLAAWPGAVWTSAAVPWGWQLAALAGGALAVMPLPWRLRLLAVPLVLPLVWPVVPRPVPGQFEVVAVDVGQGTAVLLRTATKLLVVDAGPQYGRDSDAGQRVLLPLLRARGERRIDLLLLSHRDADHVGGAAALLRGLPVARLSTSLEDGHPLRAAAPHTPCGDGQRWSWDGVDFQVLHPPAGELPASWPPNARSCVLRVAGPGGSVLLPGDVERLQELMLVERHAAALRSDVLVVPHHGSRTSSSAPFLDAVQPRVALIQAGHLNRFGHPAAEVLARLHERGIAVVASPSCGAWAWRSGAPLQGVCQRDAHRRYWHYAAVQ